MNKEEKESVAHLEWLLDNGILSSEDELHIETVLNLIQKQDKLIRKIAESFKQDDLRPVDEIIEYFKKVVDEDVKD